MLARKLGHFLLESNSKASAAALVCALLPYFGVPGGFLAVIILGLITLTRGARAGLVILAWVALPALSLLYLHQYGLFDLVLVYCVLVWLSAVILRATGSIGLVLEAGMLIGLLVVVGFHLSVNDLTVWWTTILTDYSQQAEISTQFGANSEQMHQAIALLAPMATGLITTIVWVGSLIQLYLARWWQSAIFAPGTMGKEVREIRISLIASVILMIAAFGWGIFHFNLIYDWFPILVLPFVIAALSLLHFMAKGRKAVIILLVLAYLGLIFIPQIFAVLLGLVGFIDSFYDFRRHFDQKRVRA